MHYHLSSRQTKALLIRHTPLQIAIPAPEVDPPDWLEWARSVMDSDIRDHITRAVAGVIAVGPPRGSDGLASVIGEIDPHDRSLVWMVEVVLLDIQPIKSLHPCLRLQWPKCVDTAGVRWPLE
jgi:hypothetical protein